MRGECNFCKKKCGESENYCSWKCKVDEARAAGGAVCAPNDLPIRCVRADGTLLEHEHADHPDYVFPVTAEFVGEVPSDLPDWDTSYYPQDHALIYANDSIAVTLYECSFYLWSLHDGKIVGGEDLPTLESGKWKFSDGSLREIIAYVAVKNFQQRNDPR